MANLTLLVLSLIYGFLLIEVSSIYYRNEIKIPMRDQKGETKCEILRTYGTIINDNIKCNWVTQNIDNFNPEVGKWQQKYYVNTEFFVEKDPPVAFLLVGGEGPIVVNNIIGNRSIVRYAREHNAIIFQLEHRYYGNDYCPTKDLSLDNLRYLSSEQALEDIANFISTISLEYNLSNETKWIAFGGSYAGSLAAWLKLKHPDKIKAAISASAPMQAELDFAEYFPVVWRVLDSYNSKCSQSIIQAVEQIKELLETEKGISTLKEMFRFCYQAEYGIDIMNIINYVLSSISSPVQYGDQESSKELCSLLTDENFNSTLEGLSIFYDDNLYCLADSYRKTLERKTHLDCSLESYSYMRAWNYQTCTEFGWYQTTKYLPVDYYLQVCRDLFNFTSEEITERIKNTNHKYGGFGINVTDVVFINGGNDPWYPLCLREGINSKMTPIFIEGGSHRQFLNEEKDNDPPQLKDARKQVNELLKNWLE